MVGGTRRRRRPVTLMEIAGPGRRRAFRTWTLTVTLPLTLLLAVARSATDRVSQLTVLLYLNDDFEGGETVLYPGQHEDERPTEGGVSVSVRPVTGSILCFGQTFKFNRARVPQPVQEVQEGEVQEGLGAPCRGRSAIEIAWRSPRDRLEIARPTHPPRGWLPSGPPSLKAPGGAPPLRLCTAPLYAPQRRRAQPPRPGRCAAPPTHTHERPQERSLEEPN